MYGQCLLALNPSTGGISWPTQVVGRSLVTYTHLSMYVCGMRIERSFCHAHSIILEYRYVLSKLVSEYGLTFAICLALFKLGKRCLKIQGSFSNTVVIWKNINIVQQKIISSKPQLSFETPKAVGGPYWFMLSFRGSPL